MATAALPTMALQPVMADASKVVSIGNDLTDAEKQTMMKYFGISDDKSVQKITVTNKDEVSHLSSYIPREQIGTRTVSCTYIKPTESGGIKVKTANLQYVTANMIASTLADLGIKNCEVVSACPFLVSGTGALTGIIMAYETATGEIIDQSKKDIATQEVVVTKDLAKDIGNVKAEYVINQAKAEAVQNNISDKQEIQNTVTNIVNNNNINISNDQIENITNLTQNIVNENYGDTYINNITEINNNIKQEIAASDDIDIDDTKLTPVTEDETTKEEPKTESILDNVDESVLGEDVIASSTDDPTLIINTTENAKNNMESADSSAGSSDESADDSADDNLFDVENSDESNDENKTEDTTDNQKEVKDLDVPEAVEAEDTESATSEPTENVENQTLPENNVSNFGYDLSPIIEKHGESVAEKFMAVEDYVKEHFAFDESKQDDVDAASDLSITDTENERKEGAKEKISSAAKSVMDACYKYLTEEEHEKSILEIVTDKASDLIKKGEVSAETLAEMYADLENTGLAKSEE